MNDATPPVRHRRRGALAVAIAVVASAFVVVDDIKTAPVAEAVADSDWLGIVNTYRAMSGLNPVSSNPIWSSQGVAHSCYMLQNGLTHYESSAYPGYTPGGDLAGSNGNVAVSSSVDATARQHIDLWMTGPFHAIGILRPNLKSTGFGMCANPSTPTWHSGATLDVLRGLDSGAPKPATATVFPGNGATVPLHRFIVESPNPMTMCGWTGSAGLPLIAMLPGDVSSANSTLTGPNGPIETCTLHEGNVGDPTARGILSADNAVIVMPRTQLVDGTHSVTVNSNGGNVSWSFNVNRDGPLEIGPPDTPDAVLVTPAARFDPVEPFRHVDSRIGQHAVRLRAGKVTTIDIADDVDDVTAVSANFVAVAPDSSGFITLYNCTTSRPTVSTIGYGPGEVNANQAIVPLQNGKMCVYSLASVDLVVDINGFYRKSGGSGFTPTTPQRLYDSRGKNLTALAPNEQRAITVVGGSSGAPADATAVALNVTAVLPNAPGYVKVFPCGSPTAGQISTINYWTDDVTPNTVVTPVDDEGRVCVQSLAESDIVIDLLGYFDADAGLQFEALDPVRLFDSRSGYAELNLSTGGQRLQGGHTIELKVAGHRGIPEVAKAASVNITAVDGPSSTFVTAFPCGKRPGTSNVNLTPWQGVAANGAMLKLSEQGTLCLYAHSDVHVIVDINGIWR